MSTTQKKLLIVDDSRTSRSLIRGFVSSLRADWQIIEAGTGEEGLEKIKENPPDFVTMDVNMPGMSGLEAAGEIRWRYPNIRVSVCTGNVQAYVREAARQAGVFFSPKPITLLSMAEVISYFEAPATTPAPDAFSTDESIESSFDTFDPDHDR